MIVWVNIFEVYVLPNGWTNFVSNTPLNAHQNLIFHLKNKEGVFGMEFLLSGYYWKLFTNDFFSSFYEKK